VELLDSGLEEQARPIALGHFVIQVIFFSLI